MLLLDCAACGRRELRGPRSIERLDHTWFGILLTVTCTSCGHTDRVRPGADRRARVPEAS